MNEGFGRLDLSALTQTQEPGEHVRGAPSWTRCFVDGLSSGSTKLRGRPKGGGPFLVDSKEEKGAWSSRAPLERSAGFTDVADPLPESARGDFKIVRPAARKE